MTASLADFTSAIAGRYRIERELGQGGMATVYLAHDVKHGRNVALKVLRDDVTHTVGADRFLREIQLAARLNHPNIIALFDSGEALGVLAVITLTSDLDPLRSIDLFERALAADPALSEVRCLYGAWGFIVLGRGDERGLAELECAQRDDPLSSICAAHASIALSMVGRHEEAIHTAMRSLALNPGTFGSQHAVALAKTWGGDPAGGLAAAVPALQSSGRHPWVLGTMAHAFVWTRSGPGSCAGPALSYSSRIPAIPS